MIYVYLRININEKDLNTQKIDCGGMLRRLPRAKKVRISNLSEHSSQGGENAAKKLLLCGLAKKAQ